MAPRPTVRVLRYKWPPAELDFVASESPSSPNGPSATHDAVRLGEGSAAHASPHKPSRSQSPRAPAGRTYAVVGKGGATVRAAASLRSPVVGTVERGGKVDVVEERRARCRVAAPVAGWVSAKVLAPHATDQVAAAVTVTTASTGVVPRPVDPEAFEDPAVVTAATLARDARERYEALGVEF